MTARRLLLFLAGALCGAFAAYVYQALPARADERHGVIRLWGARPWAMSDDRDAIGEIVLMDSVTVLTTRGPRRVLVIPAPSRSLAVRP